MDKTRYPSNWSEISLRIRERANNCCEQCGVPNKALIVRSAKDAERFLLYDEDRDYWLLNGETPVRMSEWPLEFFDNKAIKVVLTVAHLNHDTQCNSEENLAALCQLHHLRHDAAYHAANSRKTRLEKRRQEKIDSGQKELF